MDTRYVCGECGVKWVVRTEDGVPASGATCAACGGVLRPLERDELAPSAPRDAAADTAAQRHP